MAILTTRYGTLASAQAAGGASANSVNMDESSAFSLIIAVTAVAKTGQLEQSIDGGATWFAIAAQQISAAGAGVWATTAVSGTNIWLIPNPVGMYQTNVTGGGAGTWTAKYMVGPTLWK